MTKDQGEAAINEAVVKRLDALIRLFIEMNKPEAKRKLNEGDAVRLLKSVDLSPTEIAKILGKNSATDISPYLYPKKKKTEDNPANKNEEHPPQKEMNSKSV